MRRLLLPLRPLTRALHHPAHAPLLRADITFDDASSNNTNSSTTPPYGYNHVRVRLGTWHPDGTLTNAAVRIASKETSLARAEREVPSAEAAGRLRHEYAMLELAAAGSARDALEGGGSDEGHRGILHCFGLYDDDGGKGKGEVDLGDADAADHVLRLVTECCEGGHLGSRAGGAAGRRGDPHTTTLSETIKDLAQVASAMAYLHDDSCVAHRDLKPANILRRSDEEGTLCVADFDRAEALCDDGLVTGYAGTLRYVSSRSMARVGCG